MIHRKSKAFNNPSNSDAETVRPVSAKVSARVGTKTAEWQVVVESLDVNSGDQVVTGGNDRCGKIKISGTENYALFHDAPPSLE